MPSQPTRPREEPSGASPDGTASEGGVFAHSGGRRAPASILGLRVDPTTYGEASEMIASWTSGGDPRYVCIANVHMTMISRDDAAFRHVVNRADLVTPDGMPLVWILRRLGPSDAARVYGPTLLLHVCERAAREGIPVGFYGGTAEELSGLVRTMEERYPSLAIAYAHAPPFRDLTPAEDATVVEDIRASGARILFVGLGCPKQERWMADHKDRLPLVQLGVGAAFAFHAGKVRQAPAWLQDRGMEWAFRLAMEPRRLWRRYLYNNPRFVLLAGLQLLGLRRHW